MERDPIGGMSGKPATLNRYAYVWNSPCGRTDPSGLWTCGVSVGSSISAVGWAGGASLGIALDDQGNYGLLPSYWIGGGIGLGASAGPSVSVTNLASIFDLLGPFLNVGGSAGEAVAIGGDAIIDSKRGLVGGQAGATVTIRAPLPIPGELHGVVNTTPQIIGLDRWQYQALKTLLGPPIAAALGTCETALDVLRYMKSKK